MEISKVQTSACWNSTSY